MDDLFNLGVNLSRGLRDNDPDIATALARKEDPQTSKDAAKKMVESGALSRQEQMVYKTIKYYIEIHSHKDFTTKDIATWIMSMSYHKAYDICRKRFSGLANKGKIKLTGGRRDGCRVWKIV